MPLFTLQNAILLLPKFQAISRLLWLYILFFIRLVQQFKVMVFHVIAYVFQVEDVRSDSEDSQAEEPDSDSETMSENKTEMNGYVNGKPAS